MLSFASPPKVIAVDHGDVVIHTPNGISSPQQYSLPQQHGNSKVILAAFLSDDSIVCVRTRDSDTCSVYIGSHHVLTRHHCRAIQLYILPMHDDQPANNENEEEEDDDDDDEIWILWSDDVFTRTLHRVKTLFYPVSEPNLVDFVVFPKHTPISLRQVAKNASTSKWLIVAISRTTLCSFHFAPTSDSGSPQRTLLAVAATSALASLVSTFAKKYLPADEEMEEELTMCNQFSDGHREFLSLVRGRAVFAVNDSLGRVMVFNSGSFQVLKLFKGYRLAKLAFLRAEAEVLAVYSPQSRGDRVELWDIDSSCAESTPFAFAQLPSETSLTFAVNGKPQHGAVAFNSDYFIPLALNGVLLNTRRGQQQHRRSSSSVDGPIRITPSAMMKMTLDEWMDHCGDLGYDFFVSTFAHRADWTEALKRLGPICRHLSKLQPPQLPSASDLHPVRRWVNDHSNNAAWFPTSDLDRFILLYLRFGLKNPFVVKFSFNVLLLGDIFAVREVQSFLATSAEDYSHIFVQWWLETPVECSSAAWKNSSLSTVSLVKFLLILFANTRETAVDMLLEFAKGKVQLARSCLFCYAMQWEMPRFTQLFARALQLNSTSATCADLVSRDYLLKRCTEFALEHVAQFPIFQSDHVEEEAMFETTTMAKSLDYLLFKPVQRLFADEEQRDAFRLEICVKLVSGEQFKVCHRVLATEMESSWPRNEPLWEAMVEHCTISHNVANLPEYRSLLLFLARREDDALHRALAEALVLAFAESFNQRLQLVEAFCDPDETTSHGKQHQGLLIDLIGHVAQTCEEDEELRRMGKRIGVDDGDSVNRELAFTHLFRGLDQRAMECFDKFESEEQKSACASDMLLKVLKLRCVLYLKEAQHTEQFATALAKWNPKTTAWLTSKSALAAASAAESHGLKLSTLPSARLVLSKLLPFLPAPPPARSSAADGTALPQPRTISSSSHHDRCLELLTLTEALISL